MLTHISVVFDYSKFEGNGIKTYIANGLGCKTSDLDQYIEIATLYFDETPDSLPLNIESKAASAKQLSRGWLEKPNTIFTNVPPETQKHDK